MPTHSEIPIAFQETSYADMGPSPSPIDQTVQARLRHTSTFFIPLLESKYERCYLPATLPSTLFMKIKEIPLPITLLNQRGK